MDLENQHRMWKSFWGETRELAQTSYPEARPIWDSDAEGSVIEDLRRFKDHIDPSLPIVDYGCGNGTQTAALAPYYSKVVGTDISADAIEMAKQFNARPNISYRVLDGLKVDQARALHDELGDVNLYMRTVLHFLNPDERNVFGQGVRTLLGNRGTLYVTELGPDMPTFLDRWIKENGMPHKLQRIISKGVSPGLVSRGDIDKLLPPDEYEVLSEGDCLSAPLDARSDLRSPDSFTMPYAPPMYFAILRRKRMRD